MYVKRVCILAIFTILIVLGSVPTVVQASRVNYEETLGIARAGLAVPTGQGLTFTTGQPSILASRITITSTTEVTPTQPPDLKLIIAAAPGGPAGELYIRQTGDAEVSGVRFFARLADAKGQQLTGVSFTLTKGGTDVTETGITVPAGPKQVLVTLNVTNLTAIGTFTGSLDVEQNDTLLQAAVLNGERLPLPMLKIRGATDAGGLSLSSRITAFRAPLRLDSTNLTEVDDLEIFVDNFIDPNGNQIPVTVTVTTVSSNPTPKMAIPGLGSVNLEIAAELPTAGDYTSAITLIYAEKRETVSLKVSRTRPAPTISILGVETATGYADGILNFLNKDTAQLWMTLHETAGQTVILNLPQLSVLSLKGAQESTSQAQFAGLDVSGEDDHVLTGPVTLEPGEIKRLLLTIRGLNRAGAYVGKLTLTAPDATSIDQDVTILIKESIIAAGLWIGLGVSASLLLNAWLNRIRPKLERQGYASRLLEDLEREAGRVAELTDGRKDVTEVVEDLRRRLEAHYDDPKLGTSTTADGDLKAID
jgi:hypothetical protein